MSCGDSPNREREAVDGWGMDDLSISSVSAMQQARNAEQVSMAVAKTALDQQRAAGAAMVELLRSAGEVGPRPGDGWVGKGRADLYA